MTETEGRPAGSLDPAAAALIRRRYSPCATIESQLASYLHAVVEEGVAVECGVRLSRLGSIHVGRNGEEVGSDALPEAGETAPAPWPTACDKNEPVAALPASAGPGGERAISISYGGECLGSLDWSAEHQAVDRQLHSRLLHDFAWCLACQLNRERLGARTSERLGSELTLVGVSDAMHRLEEYVERAAGVDLPTLICGEFGTEKVEVACAVHFGGARREKPFVEVRCAALRPGDEPTLRDRFTRAQGGSLFLNGIDELHPDLQTRLLWFLESRVGQWASRGRRAEPAVRLIASTTGDLRRRVEAGTFSPALFAELSFLPIEVPPLRRRRDDVRHLTAYALMRHNGAAARLEHDALEALEAYDWPQNLFEMERVLSRLVVLHRADSIRLEDLEELAPWVVGNGSRGEVEPERTPPPPPALTEGDDGMSTEQLARRVLSGDLDDLEHWHAGILRALRSIGERYQDAMTLGELAAAAYVSPSHLCYLFRSTLGVTFKGLLGLVRIERAKQLLVEETKRRITDISLDVGFGDLSHFEKTFKRLVKASPREYRRRRLRDLRPQSPRPVSPR